jgi:hypothetical protein
MNDVKRRGPWIFIATIPPFAILVVLAIFLPGYERPLASLLFAKSLARKTPELWIVPKPLQMDPTVPVGGKMFCRFGYQFTSPWTDVSFEKTTTTADVLVFTTGQDIAIFDESKSFATAGTEYEPENKERDQMAKTLLGYAYRSRVLNTTPYDVRWFSSRERMAATSTSITLKSFDAQYMKGGLYSFETPWLRGFQIGGPASDKQIMVELFDPQDYKFKLMIGSKQPGSGKVSQSEINQIISTLRPATSKCD